MKIINRPTLTRLLGAIALGALAVCAWANDAGNVAASIGSLALPGNSVYQLPMDLVDQDGRSFKLRSKRGQPVIVSMFYNSCQFVCPMLIDTLRDTETRLTSQERMRLSLLLVTLDPVRDNIAVLKSVTTKHELDLMHWTVARTGAADVRKIAAALGIQYRLLQNGEYNHSTALILLGRDGQILGRTSKLGEVDPAFLLLVKKATQEN